MSKARIKLVSNDINQINGFVDEVQSIIDKLGVEMVGPIPMPTKTLKVTTRRSPDGEGKASFERYQMRIHKRLIDLPANEKVLHSIMKLQIPKSVNIKIEMKG